MGRAWNRMIIVGVASVLLATSAPASAGPAQTQDYLGPGTYVFPGAADASLIKVIDEVWGGYRCFSAERHGDDLHVILNVILLCVDENLDFTGPVTMGTITVA